MKIERIVVGAFQTNCYLLAQNSELLVIDPGGASKKIIEHIEQYKEHKVVGILLTHGHFDHIGAVDKIYNKYHCPVYSSEGDLKMMRNAEYNNLAGFFATISCPLNFLETENIIISDFEVKVIHTPGHSAGSVMFVIDGNLFSGDTLFRLGVGRTDLYSGSESKLRQSLEVIYTLPDDMKVYPGHEAETTIGFEIRNNPYLG